mgnify:CR=1 FL=1
MAKEEYVETKEDIKKERIVAGIYIIANIIAIIVGFSLIAANGLATDDIVTTTFLLFWSINFVFGILTLSDIVVGFKWLTSLMWQPNRSIVSGLYKRNPKSRFWFYMHKINNNHLLSWMLWLSFWSIPMFLAQVFAPQSSIGIFVSRFVFPVRPQTVFINIDISQLFFVIFPAFGESGLLGSALSIVDSLLVVLLSFIPFFALRWIAFVVVGSFSLFAWRFIHRIVSAGQELDIIGHSLFGLYSGFLLILTGTYVSMTAMHVNNLLYWGLKNQLAGLEFYKVGLIAVSLTIFITTIALSFFIYGKEFKKLQRGRGYMLLKDKMR